MRDGQGKHHRDERDIDATDTLRCLLADWQPLQRPAWKTRRRVLTRLEAEVEHLRQFGARLTPNPRPRHDAGGIMIRGRVA